MNIWYGKVVSADRNIPFRANGAAGKARQDAYQFFSEIGMKEINMFAYTWNDEQEQLLSVRMDAMLGGVKPGDIVIQLYPNGTNSNGYNDMFFRKVHSFGAKVVGYIHDLELYRGNIEDWNNGEVSIPYQYLVAFDSIAKYDGLMVPTEDMAVRIRKDLGFQGLITVTGPHGFKTPMIPDRRKQSNTIIFAGSFEKNRSLNELAKQSPNLEFNIYGSSSGEYGINVSVDDYKNVNLMGKFDPDALIMNLEGSYGLVWDSLEYPEVVGGKGLYEQLNTPHKVSMYLAAEIPLIVWSKMSLAQYVLDNNIGWVIDDLSQLQDLITNIKHEDYQDKLSNLVNVGGLIRSGMQLKTSALEIAIQLREKSSYKTSISDFPAPKLGIDQWVIDMYEQDPHSLDDVMNLNDRCEERYSTDLNLGEQYKKAFEIIKKVERGIKNDTK